MPLPAPLPSEIYDDKVEQRVKQAARQFVQGRRKIDTVYEHGHWWIQVETPGGEQRTFSVVDAEGPGSFDGFSFEEV